MATLLHALLALGAVWFWTMRSPELRPVFQGGDVSLAVTFVAAVGDGGQTTDDGQRTTEKSEETPDDGLPVEVLHKIEGAKTGRQTTDDPDLSESRDRKSETSEIMTDPETEMPEDGSLTADDRRPSLLRDSPGRSASDFGELSRTAEPGTAAVGQATGSPAAPPSDALRQGVSGAVRMQSEIRPYYPLGARLRGEEGAVAVRVWVKPSGRASRCEVARSSGFPALDEAAMDAARRARYVSTQPGAWRAEAETTLTFRFRLTE